MEAIFTHAKVKYLMKIELSIKWTCLSNGSFDKLAVDKTVCR
jgi:hypothetical protein